VPLRFIAGWGQRFLADTAQATNGFRTLLSSGDGDTNLCVQTGSAADSSVRLPAIDARMAGHGRTGRSYLQSR